MAEAATKQAKAPKDGADAETEFKPTPVGEDRWQLKEHRNPGHWICVQVGTTVEHLLEPAFWANVARHLVPRSTIEVHWDDASQFAALYVLDAGRNWASVDILRHNEELKRPMLKHPSEQYEVAFNGPVDKFRIMRQSDS